MTARLPHLDAILKRHRIHAKFWPEFRSIVEQRGLPSRELWERMNRVAKYRAARSEIAAELTKGTDHTFPPDDYQPPADYQFYETLNPKSLRRRQRADAPSQARVSTNTRIH